MRLHFFTNTNVKISIILQYNPWLQNSASANRWLTLIEGLNSNGFTVLLLIYGGYTNSHQKTSWKMSGNYQGIDFIYVSPIVLEGYCKIRLYKYLVNDWRNKYLFKVIQSLLKDKEGIVWTDATDFGFKLALKLKDDFNRFRLFLEMSEFLDIHQYNKGNFLQRWKGRGTMRLFEKKAFYAYDGLALMTRRLLKHYQGFPDPSPQFLHLPMTVDHDRFSTEAAAPGEFKAPYIAFVGVMDDTKDGVSILIKAFNMLKPRVDNYKLYLVGSWNYDTPIHLQLIKDLGLEESVFWMNEYPRDKIPGIICNADLLVLPRPDSKQAQGGFPTKLGEYLASARPICATRVGELPDYLIDNESVFFAEPGSVDSFAKSMEAALKDSRNAKRVGANGREIAKKEFDKNIQAGKLAEFLKRL